MPTTQPSNPAPVGLPGALSQRTDGGPADRQPMRSLPDAAYGEQKAFHDLQAAAPMAADSGPAPRPPAGLFDPTSRPEEPVTSGIASGPGDGPEPSPQAPDQDAMFKADAAALAGVLPELMRSAGKADAPMGFVQFVRQLRNLQAR